MSRLLEAMAQTQVFGIPLTGLVIGGFICGVALFYLVMQRQRRRNTPGE